MHNLHIVLFNLLHVILQSLRAASLSYLEADNFTLYQLLAQMVAIEECRKVPGTLLVQVLGVLCYIASAQVTVSQL